MDDLEGIGEVVQIKISAQLAGIYAVVRDILCLDELLLDAIVRADIKYLKAKTPQLGQERDVGRHMPRGPAAGQNYLHKTPFRRRVGQRVYVWQCVYMRQGTYMSCHPDILAQIYPKLNLTPSPAPECIGFL